MSNTKTYLIVLFKNKEKRKIIKKFKTFDRAKKFFDKQIDDVKNVVFEKQIENGLDCIYELALVGLGLDEKKQFNLRDDLGRFIYVDINDGYNIINLEPYKIEESFFDISENKKINFDYFNKNYLSNKVLKMISKLNNKIILQIDNKINLFSFKSPFESLRFLETLTDYLIKNNRSDVLIVSDYSLEQKKYLYNLLELHGIKKSMLYRQFTTFSKNINKHL